MNWPDNCAAVIPCFNEQRAIHSVVAGVKRYLPDVLVIDDGSSDATGEQATLGGAAVLRHPGNFGKGEALRTGWKEAFQQGFNWALCLDGDGQHAAEDIPAFFRCAEEALATLVIGNRMEAPQGMPWLRRAVNHWMSHRLSGVAGRSVPDSQCGFRLMNLKVWSGLQVQTSHFEIESEVVLAFLRAGQKVEFVPIRTIYKGEPSKIHPLRDSLRWFKWWWQQ